MDDAGRKKCYNVREEKTKRRSRHLVFSAIATKSQRSEAAQTGAKRVSGFWSQEKELKTKRRRSRHLIFSAIATKSQRSEAALAGEEQMTVFIL